MTDINNKTNSMDYNWLESDDTEYHHLPDEKGRGLEKSFIEKLENIPEYAEKWKKFIEKYS